MKYFLLVFLTAFILIGSSLSFGQVKSLSAGKVPSIESVRIPDYTGDGSNLADVAYGFESQSSTTLSIPIPDGTPFSPLGTFTAPNFASSMVKGGDGNYYLTDVTPILFQFDPVNGVVTELGAITGTSGDLINGISYNPARNTYYLISALNFYSFNIGTFTATLIGNMGVAGSLFIDLCFDAAGVCYAYDLVTDAAYTINTSTGVATQLGPLGYDANFGQGMSYDIETNTIYLSAFNLTTFTSQLRSMNPEDGSTTLIVDWGFVQIAPFAIDVSYAPDPPTLQSPNNGATGISVNPTLTWNASSGANTYGLQISLNSTFVFPSFNFDGLAVTSFTIPINLPANTTFYWRVNASNSNGTSAYSATRNFTTVTQVNLSQTISFPNKTNPKDYSTADYKIVGLPGDGDLNVSTLLSGSQGTDWEVYWDNGNDANDYLVKYNSSNPFRFSAGAAYWIIRKGNMVINQTVPAVRVNSSGYFEIPLQDGFNLITNPFDMDVNWTSVLTANGLPSNTPLNSYSGGFSVATTMQPFAGYLFDNSTNLTTLLIPYPLTGSPLLKMNNQEIWSINVDLECNEYFDRSTSFGVSRDALEDRDIYDHRKPRAIGNIPMVYFYNPKWDSDYSSFATDIRPEFVDEQTWNLRVNSELRDKIKLKFSGIEEITSDMNVYLIDEDRASFVDLKKNQDYEFIPAKDISDFKVLVGKSEYIDSEINNLLPKEFVLGGNFPNPFNPSTTIEVSVPKSSDLRLTIYNILGQEIRVLFEGAAEPGKHWHVWDGKDQQGISVPSGIYIYSLKTNNGINISRKMVLMK